MLTHGNMVANMQQAARLAGHKSARRARRVVITALPLYHIFSLTANCLVFMKIGGLNVLITNPRDMPGFVKELAKVPLHRDHRRQHAVQRSAQHAGFRSARFLAPASLTLGGGMAVQRAVAEQWKKVTKCTLVEAYGLTETSPAACINPLDLPEYNGSIGLPIPSTDVPILDDDGKRARHRRSRRTVHPRPAGDARLLAAPRGDRQGARRDGWLHTGDIARMDAKGYFYIVDRKKDMILVSGFNVYPNEIEDVVAAMPGRARSRRGRRARREIRRGGQDRSW